MGDPDPLPYRDLLPEPPLPADDGLFLGRYTAAALERELEAAGILAALGKRGYRRLTFEIETGGGPHRLRILASEGEPPLIDLRASEDTCAVGNDLMRRHGLDVLYVLAVHRLVLPDRPPLPGQAHPGLGFGRRFYDRLRAWAHAWGKDALVYFPEHFHVAASYSRFFRFLAPWRQGWFEALVRDLGGVPVAEASAALHAGRVIDTATGAPAQWETAEMASALTATLVGYLESEDYRRAAEAARERACFRLEAPP